MAQYKTTVYENSKELIEMEKNLEASELKFYDLVQEKDKLHERIQMLEAQNLKVSHYNNMSNLLKTNYQK